MEYGVQVFTFDTYTDSAEFCPRNDNGCVLAVGMYRLDEQTTERTGKVAFLEESSEGFRVSSCLVPLESGLLDMKWLDDTHIVAATAQGACILSQQAVLSSGSLGGLGLCVDISKGKALAFSTSLGQVCLFPDAALLGSEPLSSWKAHSLETWCVGFDVTLPDILYTGADDALLKAWDTREGVLSRLLFTNKQHRAGVCSIIPGSDPSYIFTGSYDRCLRKIDLRSPLKVLAEHQFSSGVWRLKRRGSQILAACMHDGFHLIDEGLSTSQQIATSCSLAYGCSWSPCGRYVAGASFYDATIKVVPLDV